MTRRLSTLVGLAVVLTAATAHANEPTDAERSLARREYKRGVAAAEAGQWEQARSAFRRAYDIVRLPAILYNLAGAQAQTGRLVEAAESYRKFLREGTDSQSQPLRPNAQEFLLELEPRIPGVQLEVEGLLESDQLLVDGEEVTHAAVGGRLPLNPGAHTIAVERSGRTAASERVQLGEGDSRGVQLQLPAPTPEELARDETAVSGGSTSGAATTGSTDEGDDVVTSPWLWTGVGAAVVAGVVAAVLLTRPSGQSAYEGTLPTIDFR